jgi:hypothetical protein
MHEAANMSVTPQFPTSAPAGDGERHDLTGQLRALMTLGFRFAHPRRPNGDIAAVVGVRAHHNVVDLVQLLGEHDADAVRIPGDEPDILSPRHVLWRATGPAHDVLQQVLDLGDTDNAPATDTGQNGCWLSTGPHRSVWLPAT